jgi:hypothetical protein
MKKITASSVRAKFWYMSAPMWLAPTGAPCRRFFNSLSTMGSSTATGSVPGLNSVSKVIGAFLARS